MTLDTPRSLRVFVNAVGVNVPAGASALDAVRQWNADEADKVARGERVITDSRGLPIASDARVSAGSIFRLVAARRGAANRSSSDSDDETT
jgi:hypothetical protein